MPVVAGFGIFLAILAVIIKVGVIVYFFILLNRLIHAVERIEQKNTSTEAALKSVYPK